VLVQTDRATLRYFATQPRLTPRLERWSELLANLDLHIEYTPGKLNTVPDALSRRPDLRMLLLAALVATAPSTHMLRRIRTAYPTDPTAVHLLRTATSAKANPAYRSISGMLYFVDEGRYRLYVPSNDGIKSDLLHDHHDVPSAGHHGVARMLGALQQYFYWPHMHQDVANYVRSCRACLLNKPCGQAPTTIPLPTQPFEEVALDWIGPLPLTPRGHDFCLNLTDRLTKFALAIPCQQTMDKHELAETLHYKLHCAHGIPRVIVSDRDQRIDNEFFRLLNQLQGTTHWLTTSHRP
jgi:hypothetical protein